MSGTKVKEILWMTALTIPCIVCFPVNPLVLTGLIEPGFYLPLYVLAWIIWAIGMVLVMAPIVMFPRRGGVPKGKSFVYTTKLVDSGIYAIFLTNFLANPHWLFGVLGVIGTIITYINCREEDQHLIEKFGDDYVAYMQKVPGMNFILGIIRVVRAKKDSKDS